jgi:crossover junction endodeoxyribonuclease RuvC
MKVIGIDPGSKCCGYGVIEVSGGDIKHMASGSITPGHDLLLYQRLKSIYEELLSVIGEHSPDVMSVEDIFFAKNARSAIKLGEARGVVLLAASNTGIPVYEYSATKVKLALTGQGRANKSEVQKMLSMMLGKSDFETEDASDALAVALCHVNNSRIEARLGKEFTRPRSKRRRFTLNDIPVKG